MLGHLCYASGSSEPGKAEPTLDQAKQRVDNFAAGFLAAGARAVIAEAYGRLGRRVRGRGLFTAHTTVGTIWATSFSKQGTPFSFPSTRTPGMTAQMDPDHSSGKYYRAIVGDPNLRATPSWAIRTGDGPDAPRRRRASRPRHPQTPRRPHPPSATHRVPDDADADAAAARPRRRHRPTTARSISRAPESP